MVFVKVADEYIEISKFGSLFAALGLDPSFSHVHIKALYFCAVIYTKMYVTIEYVWINGGRI